MREVSPQVAAWQLALTSECGDIVFADLPQAGNQSGSQKCVGRADEFTRPAQRICQMATVES